MSERVWDRFLTDQDRAHLAATEARQKPGFGDVPVVLSIDNYRWVVGDEPQPLLEAVERWPGSTGLAGWQALAHIQTLLAEARQARIPVIHMTAEPVEESGVAPWYRDRPRTPDPDGEAQDRQARRYDLVPQAAPEPGEVVVRKSAPSAFFGTPLVGHLNALRADTLIVCGESTSGCVRASVVDGCTYRFRVVVVEECVYDRHEAAHALNLFDMDQKYADVLPLERVVGWMREYGRARSQPAEA